MGATIDTATTEAQTALFNQPLAGYEAAAPTLDVYGQPRYQAKDLRLGRTVEIITLQPDLAAREDATGRFFNEAAQAAPVRAKELVRALDVGRGNDCFYYVAKYERGETLREKLARLQSGKLRELETLKLIAAAAGGLQVIKDLGLTHRDICPENILLGAGGQIMLREFGLAREVAYPDDAAYYAARAAYVAPEAAADEPGIDIRADLYALGCVWYEALLGRPPFVAAAPAVVLRQHLSDDPANPCEVEARLTPATGQLIMWLLAKEPAKRPAQPRNFLSKLSTHPLLKLSEAGVPAAPSALPATPAQDP